MSNYILLPQTIESMPMADQVWYWYDPYRIIQTSLYKEDLLKNIPEDMLQAYNFRKATNTTGAYARFDRTNYPIKIISNPILDVAPNFSIRRKLDFTKVTDDRAIELLARSQLYSSVLLFYSGGIDSTMILCAILKNWSKVDLAKVTIVMNQYSIDENKNMFDSYISGKFLIVNTNEYFTESKINNDTLYVTGSLGDPLMADESNTTGYDELYPNCHNRSWRDNIDSLVKYFTIRSDPAIARYVVRTVARSLAKCNFEVETVYEFFWWINFNWGWDIDIFQSMWYWRLAENTDTKQFLEDNHFIWFNTVDYQDWAINTVGTSLMVGDSIKMSKYSMKKYIYDFNHDLDYFLHKVHEGSVSKNKLLMTTALCGIDSNYNIYYRKLNSSIPLRITP
jgi:hypothetical protein